MSTPDSHAGNAGAYFSVVDEEAEEERRQKRIDATSRRAAAYDYLSIGDEERAAMEWACARRGISTLAAVRPLFDEAESIDDDGVSQWLEGPLFSAESVDKLRAGLAEAVRLHEKSQRKDQFAARAENATIWFLRIAVIGIVLIVLGGLVLRGTSSSRARVSFFRWYDVYGPVNAEQRDERSLSGLDYAIQSAA